MSSNHIQIPSNKYTIQQPTYYLPVNPVLQTYSITWLVRCQWLWHGKHSIPSYHDTRDKIPETHTCKHTDYQIKWEQPAVVDHFEHLNHRAVVSFIIFQIQKNNWMSKHEMNDFTIFISFRPFGSSFLVYSLLRKPRLLVSYLFPSVICTGIMTQKRSLPLWSLTSNITTSFI